MSQSLSRIKPISRNPNAVSYRNRPIRQTFRRHSPFLSPDDVQEAGYVAFVRASDFSKLTVQLHEKR